MNTETKLDYLDKKYLNKINYLKTEEERQKAARVMMDKSRMILTDEEDHYYKNKIFIQSKLTWQHDGKREPRFSVHETCWRSRSHASQL